MNISALDKAQWISVGKTTLYAAAGAAFAVFVASNFQVNRIVVGTAIGAALAAALKTIEKLFMPVV